MEIPNLCKNKDCDSLGSTYDNNCNRTLIGHVKYCHKINQFLLDCFELYVENITEKCSNCYDDPNECGYDHEPNCAWKHKPLNQIDKLIDFGDR